jgi:predicted GIY-YIG superfamily endonuclease
MQIGYIYRLSAPETNKIYIGSSINPTRRFEQHKRQGTISSKIVMEYSGAKMDILETIEFDHKNKLKEREAHHILTNISNCVNKQRPLRTKSQYYQDNKDKLNDHSNSVILCHTCHKTYTLRNKARHYKKYCRNDKNNNLILLLLFLLINSIDV